jgi:cytochrome c
MSYRPFSRIAASALVLALGCSLLVGAARAADADDDAAYSLMKKSDCFKCHSVDKRKKAPAYKEIAAKYRGKANAETTLFKHLTGAPIVKLEDGDEQHDELKVSESEVRNVVRWVLSR